MITVKELMELIFKPAPVGRCVICGQETSHTKAGQFVCGYNEPNSLNCSEVWNERRLRDTWVGIEDEDPRDHGYSPFRQEGYTDYRSYITSYDWQVKAESLKRDVFGRCQGCGKVERNFSKLHVHHKHYKTLYYERRQDVEVLCEKCHAKRHGK